MAVILLWILGVGIGSMQFGRAADYQTFIFPGIIGFILLVTSIRSGISVLRDREMGFLRVLLIAPVSRVEIVLGKILGGTLESLIQFVLLMALGFVVGVKVSPVVFLTAFGVAAISAATFVALGILIAVRFKHMESFTPMMSILILPMFFLSGALFPVFVLPDWMQALAAVNPLTYAVDALRGLLIEWPQANSLAHNLGRLLGFFVLFFAAAVFLVSKERIN